MNLLELIVLALGLAMDAFAVSICKGLELENINYSKCNIISTYFSVFQMAMPMIGYILGNIFKYFMYKIDHWIAFFLLSIIGINMIKESAFKDKKQENNLLDFKTLLPLAIATSIDALAVGITLSVLKVNLISALVIIGIITYILSFIGVIIGNKIGSKISHLAELFGGIILLLIGIKILFEHLN